MSQSMEEKEFRQSKGYEIFMWRIGRHIKEYKDQKLNVFELIDKCEKHGQILAMKKVQYEAGLRCPKCDNAIAYCSCNK